MQNIHGSFIFFCACSLLGRFCHSPLRCPPLCSVAVALCIPNGQLICPHGLSWSGADALTIQVANGTRHISQAMNSESMAIRPTHYLLAVAIGRTRISDCVLLTRLSSSSFHQCTPHNPNATCRKEVTWRAATVWWHWNKPTRRNEREGTIAIHLIYYKNEEGKKCKRERINSSHWL